MERGLGGEVADQSMLPDCRTIDKNGQVIDTSTRSQANYQPPLTNINNNKLQVLLIFLHAGQTGCLQMKLILEIIRLDCLLKPIIIYTIRSV